MIYVIADDLTGATDTGVQFSKQGYNTQVIIASEFDFQKVTHSGKLYEENDVLVIDTETREADSPTTRKRIKHILQHTPVTDNDIVYKKVDSTLRGNVGVELDECLKVLKKDLCIFTPSFPSNQRITVEGYLIVQDQPLGLSEYYTGNLEPGEASYIPSLLQHETDFPIARIDLKYVIQGTQVIFRKIRELFSAGKKILVVDAINESQLSDILKSSFDVHGSVLYAGSAGLANALSELYNGAKHIRTTPRHIRKPVLVVNGSMSSITRRQIDHVKKSVNLCNIVIDVERLLSIRERHLQELLSRAHEALQDGQHVLIYPDPLYLEEQNNQQILSKYHLNFRELAIHIRDFLGALTADILEYAPLKNVILTGGDTAIGVCSALGIYNLNIMDELLPGIPLCTGFFKEKALLNIVTKAGGFGEENALTLLIDKLTRFKTQQEEKQRGEI
jgi:uncharacterized protein YgbK (DUF1537 family)